MTMKCSRQQLHIILEGEQEEECLTRRMDLPIQTTHNPGGQRGRGSGSGDGIPNVNNELPSDIKSEVRRLEAKDYRLCWRRNISNTVKINGAEAEVYDRELKQSMLK